MIAVSNQRKMQFTQPMMYIDQPKFTAKAKNRKFILVNIKNDNLSAEQEETPTEEVSETKENKIEQGVQRKTFALKSIDEKLQFLTNLPSTMPSVTCEFRTKKEIYVGILIGYTEDTVSIRHGISGKIIKIQRRDLSSIAIIRL